MGFHAVEKADLIFASSPAPLLHAVGRISLFLVWHGDGDYLVGGGCAPTACPGSEEGKRYPSGTKSEKAFDY